MKFRIEAGELKHPITIERVKIDKINNIPKNTWTKLYNTRAKIVNVRGSEIKIGEGSAAKVEKSFYIRFPRGIDITRLDRVIFKNKIYNIEYLNNIDEEDIFLEIRGILHE
ncbi:phage head closure protein [Clostridium celatum]|uniref:phage head closure protein n=1 Tax=Clostridium celatum TaxID=36834 RepID=UPI002900AC1E|nr:phage head closure protein [Clostridium celatum]MDU2266691.1 phage head closure protein [Clostridium celatum]MDU6297064.1 phage head closure protein [Clostridium celatum]